MILKPMKPTLTVSLVQQHSLQFQGVYHQKMQRKKTKKVSKTRNYQNKCQKTSKKQIYRNLTQTRKNDSISILQNYLQKQLSLNTEFSIISILFILLQSFTLLLSLNTMNFIHILFLMVVIDVAYNKIVKKTIQLQAISKIPQTIYLTKFDIGVGSGNFTIKYRTIRNEGIFDFDKVSLQFGLLKDNNYSRFRKSQTCRQKKQLYWSTKSMSFVQSSWGGVVFQINQEQSQHIWYLYLFDCTSEKDLKQLVGTISLDITMINNQSHFGEDENFLFGYILLLIIWLILVIRFFIPVAYSIKSPNTTSQQILIYCGFLLLGLSYMYRLLQLILIYLHGEEIWGLEILYSFLKYLVQGVMVTIIVSISWGWSLTHLKHQPYYIIIGTITAIVNFLAIVLDSSAKQLQQAHHQYDRLIGITILCIRIVIFIVFVGGILKYMAQSVGKRKHFLRKFGYQGGLYLIAWPLAVIFVQIFLPNYMHNEVVTVIQQGAHIIANAYMCHLFAFPQSDFQKVSLKQEDEMFPIYRKKGKNEI